MVAGSNPAAGAPKNNPMENLIFWALWFAGFLPLFAFASNQNITILDASVKRAEGNAYLYIRWRLDSKEGLTISNWQAVALVPSLNGNLTNGGQLYITGTEPYRALSKWLDGDPVASIVTWQGGSCSAEVEHSSNYMLGREYTTRFPKVYDADTDTYIPASQIDLSDVLRISIFNGAGGVGDNGPGGLCSFATEAPSVSDTEDYPIDVSALEPVVFVPGILGTRLIR